MTHRRTFVLLAAVFLLGGAAAGCGSEDDGGGAAPPSTEATTTTTGAAADGTTGGPDGEQPDAGPGPDCDVVAGADVAEALGVDAVTTVVDVPSSAGRSACTFTAGDWEVGVTSVPLSPAMTATSGPLPTLPGVDAVHAGWVEQDRSGRWAARAMVAVGDRNVEVSVRNLGSGSDTYPPSEGPEQQPATREAGVRVVNAVLAHGATTGG